MAGPLHVGLELGPQRVLKLGRERPSEALEEAGRGDRSSVPGGRHGHSPESSANPAVAGPPCSVRAGGEGRVQQRPGHAPGKARQVRGPAPDVFAQQRAHSKFDAGPGGSAGQGAAHLVRKTEREPPALAKVERPVERGFGGEKADPLPTVGSLEVGVPTLAKILRRGGDGLSAQKPGGEQGKDDNRRSREQRRELSPRRHGFLTRV